MPIDPAQLLRRLEPPVRPDVAPAPIRAGAPPLERQSFDSLLALVSDGSVRSDRPVVVRDRAAIGIELDQAKLDRIASAADLAEAAGAGRAVLLLDGRGLLLDVAERSITGELRADDAHRLVHIDAAIQLANETDLAPTAPARLPGRGVLPEALARLFDPQLNAPPTAQPHSPTARRAG